MKKIILNEKYKNETINKNNCENIVKSLIYEDNIKYNNVEIIKNNAEQPEINFNNVIYIFDNGALTGTGVGTINNLFNTNNNKIKLYVPFVYLCERKIIETHSFDKLIQNINNLKNKFNIDIFFDNYKNADGELLEKYKLQCQQIGGYLSNEDFYVINYNTILSMEETKDDKIINNRNKQFTNLQKYLNDTPKNDFYNLIPKDFHKIFNQHFDKIIENPPVFFKYKWS